jgi:hypothetical protein
MEKISLSDKFACAICNIKVFSLERGVAGIYLVPNGVDPVAAEDTVEANRKNGEVNNYRIPLGTNDAIMAVACVLEPVSENNSRVNNIVFFGPDGNEVLVVGGDMIEKLATDDAFAEEHRIEFTRIMEETWGAEDAGDYINFTIIEALKGMKHKHDQLKIAHTIYPIPLDENGEFIMAGYASPFFALDGESGRDLINKMARTLDIVEEMVEEAQGEAYAKEEAADANERNIPSP